MKAVQDGKVIPFRMRSSDKDQRVFDLLHRYHITLHPDSSMPYDLILYRGGDTVITLTDEWWWNKYESIMILTPEDFEETHDTHTETAAEIFGVAQGDVTPEMRTAGKRANFKKLYGGR